MASQMIKSRSHCCQICGGHLNRLLNLICFVKTASQRARRCKRSLSVQEKQVWIHTHTHTHTQACIVIDKYCSRSQTLEKSERRVWHIGRGGSVHCRMLGILLIAEPCKVCRVSAEPDTSTNVLSFPLAVYSLLKRSKTGFTKFTRYETVTSSH